MFISFLAASCSAESAPEKSLPSCWNINDLDLGRFVGQGIFITSMEGISLQAPGCDDSNGYNSFKLSPPVDQAIRDYMLRGAGERFIGFTFHGRVANIGNRKQLVIDSVDQIQGAEEPRWLADLERSH
ncbi:hypothetical protein [Novosphingobium sp. UBA1939]|uniref:hypothetical protein n=1 Tax=Novosphingobium sp. UBA1939 TaxID=1946982 RepID=UPI0025D76CA5|nr:hypothetical protein [Novosphingobium sp. UBA1939]